MVVSVTRIYFERRKGERDREREREREREIGRNNGRIESSEKEREITYNCCTVNKAQFTFILLQALNDILCVNTS